ncbi:MAG: dihydrodipicolinate synthase family protein [Lentisphaeria bacterium]|nr:dihydrodipicolinate synthase family protein [Lentisphaeria bacterium]
MSKIKFTGIMPALITPLDAAGKIKKDTVKVLVDRYLAAGVDGFYSVGGTGEGVLLTLDQRKAMAEAAIEANAGRGKVIVHTGAINSLEVLELTRFATAAGADGISSILPSIYFKYNFNETVRFYSDIAKNTDLPILIYANHTGGGINMNELMAELLKIDNICGAKDTRSSNYAMWQLKQLNGGDINVINGPDEALLCGLCMGADGGIGATYGAMPEIFVGIYRAYQAGNLSEAQRLQFQANKIIKVMLDFASGSVVKPLKEMLRINGIDAGYDIYPADGFTPERSKALVEALKNAGYEFWQ